MSSEMQGDLQLELADRRQDSLRANHDARDAMDDSPEQTHDLSKCKRLTETTYEGSSRVPDEQHFMTCDEEKAVKRQPIASPQQRDWKNVCTRNNADRHVATLESHPRPTAGSALKSILQKHHARVRSGNDRILDLRDF